MFFVFYDSGRPMVRKGIWVYGGQFRINGEVSRGSMAISKHQSRGVHENGLSFLRRLTQNKIVEQQYGKHRDSN